MTTKKLKLVFVFLVLFLSFCLTGCGKENNNEENKKIELLIEVKNEIMNNMPLELKEEDGTSISFPTVVRDIIIEYKSDLENVISNDGVIHYPSIDTFVTIEVTFKLSNNDDSYKEIASTIIVVRKGKSVEENLEEIKNDLITSIPTETKVDLTLKKESLYNSTVRYVSNKPDILDNDGKIKKEVDEEVVLSIYVTLDGKEYKVQDVNILVKAKKDDTSIDQKLFEIEMEVYSLFSNNLVTKNVNLITSSLYDSVIRYESSDESILSSTGVVGENINKGNVCLSFYISINGTEYGPYPMDLVVNTFVINTDVEQKLGDIEMDIYNSFGNDTIKENINLLMTSMYGAIVRYETSNEDVLSATGVVGADIENTKVTLTFYITLDEIEYGPYNVELLVNTHVKTNDMAYYQEISDSLRGNNLKLALRSLTKRTQTHTTTYDEIKTYTVRTDADPNKPGNIILFYSRVSVSGKWDSGKTWNREHVWPRSKSWFEYEEAGSDIHHLRPTNPSINSSRGNKAYANTTTSTTYGPTDEVKGDIARIVFYLLTRYQESDSYPITNVASSMKMLLEWNALDPVDNLEIHRNEECYKIQGNRNPFIDFPDYAEMIWGSVNLSVDYTEPRKFACVITYEAIIEDITKKDWV